MVRPRASWQCIGHTAGSCKAVGSKRHVKAAASASSAGHESDSRLTRLTTCFPGEQQSQARETGHAAHSVVVWQAGPPTGSGLLRDLPGTSLAACVVAAARHRRSTALCKRLRPYSRDCAVPRTARKSKCGPSLRRARAHLACLACRHPAESGAPLCICFSCAHTELTAVAPAPCALRCAVRSAGRFQLARAWQLANFHTLGPKWKRWRV